MMKKQADIIGNDQILSIQGALDFSNVMSVYKKSLAQIRLHRELMFDFAKLNSSNSAGLALIIEWIKLSKQQNKIFHFKNLPADILSLAKAAGVDKMVEGV